MSEDALQRLVHAAVADAIAPLAAEVRTLRSRLGEATLSQKEVCARYRVSPSTVARRQRDGALTRLGTAKRPRYCARECDRVFTS